MANNQGSSTTTTFSWTINQAQVAPVLSSPGDQSDLTGDNVNLQVSATQVDNDPIFYDADNLPVGLSIDPDSGLLSGASIPAPPRARPTPSPSPPPTTPPTSAPAKPSIGPSPRARPLPSGPLPAIRATLPATPWTCNCQPPTPTTTT